jgi:hypothetical protein
MNNQSKVDDMFGDFSVTDSMAFMNLNQQTAQMNESNNS